MKLQDKMYTRVKQNKAHLRAAIKILGMMILQRKITDYEAARARVVQAHTYIIFITALFRNCTIFQTCKHTTCKPILASYIYYQLCAAFILWHGCDRCFLRIKIVLAKKNVF